MGCHRLNNCCLKILVIELVRINAMLLTHIYKGGNPNTVAGAECILELSFTLGGIVFLAKTTDGLKDSKSVLPKIGEGKGSLCPLVKRLKHIDATSDNLVGQCIIIVVIHE